jgi:hypothetical protein
MRINSINYSINIVFSAIFINKIITIKYLKRPFIFLLSVETSVISQTSYHRQ